MSMPIPSGIFQILLPKSDLNVLDLSHFSIPSSPNASGPALLPYPDSELFSNLASMVGEGHVAFLRALPMPSLKEVKNLEMRFIKYRDSNKNHDNPIQSILYRHNALDIRLPLWVLEYWKAANEVHRERLHWEPAIEWLRKKKHYEAIELLSQVPWTYQLPRTMGYYVSDLAPLCSERWLGGEHIDSMLEVLKDHLDSEGMIQTSIQGIQFMWKLIEIYRYSHDKHAEAQNCKFIQEFADKLKTAKVSIFGTAIAVTIGRDDVLLPKGDEVRANHWCAVVINTKQLTIQYGDPMGKAPPSELLDVIHWWLGLSFSTTFSLHNLPITQQKDSFSCAIFANNALSHHFIPTIPLLHNGEPCVLARLDALVGIIKLLKKRVSRHNLTWF
jgi:Ulp1 protease family, C-terminal catalytic domain